MIAISIERENKKGRQGKGINKATSTTNRALKSLT